MPLDELGLADSSLSHITRAVRWIRENSLCTLGRTGAEGDGVRLSDERRRGL